MNISTRQLAELVRQYPELFKNEALFGNQRYGEKLLAHLVDFSREKNGAVNNENFLQYLGQQKDFEKEQLAKVKQGFDAMPAQKGIPEFGRDIYTIMLLSGESDNLHDKKAAAAIAQAMLVIGAHQNGQTADAMLPPPPLTQKDFREGLVEPPRNAVQKTEPRRKVWSTVSVENEAPDKQPQSKNGLRKKVSGQKKIAQEYPAAEEAAQQRPQPQQARRRIKKKKSLAWRLAKITGGATAVGFGGGLFWAGTTEAAGFLSHLSKLI